MYFLPIICAHTITTSLIASNYQNCEIIYSFEVLPTIWKNFISCVEGFLNLPPVTGKIYLSLRTVLRYSLTNDQNIKCHIGKDFVYRAF